MTTLSCASGATWRTGAVAAAIWLLTSAHSAAQTAPDEPYQLGRGLTLGAFNIAGYSDLTLNIPDSGQRTIALADFSIFIAGHVSDVLNPFVETELTGTNLVEFNRPDIDPSRRAVVVERIYNDFELSDSLTVRLGKMLAPVGEWNQIHAAPLVPTSVRPAVSYRDFSEYVSGLSVLYAEPSGSSPDVQIFVQPGDEFAARPEILAQQRYGDLEGLHITLPLSLRDKIGLTFERERLRTGGEEWFTGIDAHYTLGRVTLLGEASFSAFTRAGAADLGLNIQSPPGRRLETGGHRETGLYGMASYALDDRWSAYGWYEGFVLRGLSTPAQDLLAGIAFRPVPAIVGKIEFLGNVGGQPVNPTGLFVSWSILF